MSQRDPLMADLLDDPVLDWALRHLYESLYRVKQCGQQTWALRIMPLWYVVASHVTGSTEYFLADATIGLKTLAATNR
jgi:hypothetical protein